ncbi:MAG: hypothetical protein ACTSUE_24335 [Promethearchaeota archaeon]
MDLKCPECSARAVEKLDLDSKDAKAMLYDLNKNQGITLPEFLRDIENRDYRGNIIVLFCKKCKNFEIIDIKKKEVIVKTKYRGKRERILSLFGSFFISILLVGGSINLIFFLEITGEIDIQVLPFESFNAEVVLWSAVLTTIAILFFYGLSQLLLKTMMRFPRLLSFTLKLHRLSYGDDKLYFFEYMSEREKTYFKSTLLRSLYGSILILGLAIMVIENFLTIPDLKPYFWDAANITIISVLIALPLIQIFLYVSPLITKEINLYFHNKKNRIVKNVGEWLDNSLQFFAAIDILFTIIILVDSGIMIGYLLVLLCLVLIVFSWFVVFTVIFNTYYHSEMKNKYKEFLKQKYLIPVRKVNLEPEYHYCQKCGNLLDFVHDDTCPKCKEEITKCMICGDLLDKSKVKMKKKLSMQASLSLKTQIIKMQQKLDHDDEDYDRSIECRECGGHAHVDEFYSWLKMRGTCPSCKKRINDDNYYF